MVESVLYNCSATVQKEEGKWIPKGNCSEIGIIQYLLNQGV